MTETLYGRIVYLASPYTHDDIAVRIQRYKFALAAAVTLVRRGIIVFAPIAYTHHLDLALTGTENTMGSDYWIAFDQAYMDRCDSCILLQLDGWQESKGVTRELAYFRQASKPIRRMLIDEIDDDLRPAAAPAREA